MSQIGSSVSSIRNSLLHDILIISNYINNLMMFGNQHRYKYQHDLALIPASGMVGRQNFPVVTTNI